MDRVRPEFDIALTFLRIKAHKVSEFSPGTHHCIVDGIEVSDLGLIALAQLYGREWFDFLEERRFEEKMQTRTLAHVI